MRCPNCSIGMIPTSAVCLCGHKQFVCPKCKHIWSYDHKTPGAYEIDWNKEVSLKKMIKENSEMLGVTNFEAYVDKMMVEWKKNLR